MLICTNQTDGGLKDKVLMWCSIYDQKQSLWDRQTEKHLGLRLRNSGSLSKTDLKTLVHWKFQALPGRRKIVMARVTKLSEREIAKSFRLALSAPDEEHRIRMLDGMPGIGPAMVSVILTFYDPGSYGVLDIHVWRELFGPEPGGLFQGSRCLLRFLQELRTIAAMHDMKARAVEKALFQRNYENPNSSLETIRKLTFDQIERVVC